MDYPLPVLFGQAAKMIALFSGEAVTVFSYNSGSEMRRLLVLLYLQTVPLGPGGLQAVQRLLILRAGGHQFDHPGARRRPSL